MTITLLVLTIVTSLVFMGISIIRARDLVQWAKTSISIYRWVDERPHIIVMSNLISMLPPAIFGSIFVLLTGGHFPYGTIAAYLTYAAIVAYAIGLILLVVCEEVEHPNVSTSY